MTELSNQVKAILADVLGVDEEEITSQANLVNDLAAESIDFVDITYGLEQEFNIKINPGDIFPAFLKEVTIFDENNQLTQEVKDKFQTGYPHISNEIISQYENNHDPNIFFSVSVIEEFIKFKKIG